MSTSVMGLCRQVGPTASSSGWAALQRLELERVAASGRVVHCDLERRRSRRRRLGAVRVSVSRARLRWCGNSATSAMLATRK